MARSLTSLLEPHERIILPWDQSTFTDADKRKLERLLPYVGMVKIGYQSLFTLTPTGTLALDLMGFLAARGFPYFLDAKLKDIDKTIAAALTAIRAWPYPPHIVTVHCAQKVGTLVSALDALRGTKIMLAGVSLTTDHEDADALDIYGNNASIVVLAAAERLKLASEITEMPAALVCGAPDLEALADYEFECFIKITPGICGKDEPRTDQKRTMTAAEALSAGADYIVVGRSIMNAADPFAAAKRIADEISFIA